MSELSITLIDVGWGDSILVESVDDSGHRRYGLVDCNDTSISRSSFLFVKRHLERIGEELGEDRRMFDFVVLTHGHADHVSGIQSMMSYFKTNWFWYPKSVEHGGFAKIINYANRYPAKVLQHQAIDNTKDLPSFGDVDLKPLWPPHSEDGPYDKSNENNNSIVLALTLNNVGFVLTGDCEAGNWVEIRDRLREITGLAVFQVPHHGALNGVFDDSDNTPWLDTLPDMTRLAISSHIKPYNHPAPRVVDRLSDRTVEPFRTDQHYHLTFTTDGTVDDTGVPTVTAKWSHP